MYTTGQQGSQEGNQLEEATNCIKRGDHVFYLSCDASIGGCMDNPKFDKIICKTCTFFQNYRNKKYLLGEVEHHWISEYVTEEIIDRLKAISWEYSNFEELKALRYDGVDIGMGAVSTYISLTRNMSFLLDEGTKKYLNALLYQQMLLTVVVEKIFRYNSPDFVIFHNGRFAQYKPILNIAQKYNIDFLCTETLILPSGEILKNYYKNDIPHSVLANHNKYNNLWELLSDKPQIRNNVARSFFERRKNSKYAGDKVYTLNQKLGTLPDDWDDSKENIAIFNSSEDEFCAVSKEFDENTLFNSQLDGLKIILEHYKNDTTKHFYLRIHPNLMTIVYKYHLDIYKLKYNNFTIIPANSPVSTYSLIDIADKVIVFGSTVGIEAVYWGKPVICLSCAYYILMNIVYLPKTIKELYSFIDNKDLECLYNDNVLKYGLFYMSNSFDKNIYVSNNLKCYTFFGKEYKVPTCQNYFGSNLLYIIINSIVRRTTNFMKISCRFKYIPSLEL